MKTLITFLATLALAGAFGSAHAAAHGPTTDRLAAAGLFIQEFWMGGRPGYWIGNTTKDSITITLTGCRAPTKSNPAVTELNVGPLTIPPSGALSVDVGDFVGLANVLVRDSNGLALGVLYPPKAPPRASLEPGDVVHLSTVLNSVAPRYSPVWFELSGLPERGDRIIEAQLKINGPQGGFIVIGNSKDKVFGGARIATVTSSGLPIKQATTGDWYIDARRPAEPLLQTVLITYDIPAVKQPTLVLIDARLEDTRRILVPLARAVLIGQTFQAPLHANRIQNRSNGGR